MTTLEMTVLIVKARELTAADLGSMQRVEEEGLGLKLQAES